MWDLPGPGLETVSPALAGGFLTTVPPGKPKNMCFEFILICLLGKIWDAEGITPPLYPPRPDPTF